jgi:hypothetical protein
MICALVVLCAIWCVVCAVLVVAACMAAGRNDV